MLSPRAVPKAFYLTVEFAKKKTTNSRKFKTSRYKDQLPRPRVQTRTMASSSNSVSSSVVKYRFFGELEGGVTFILHNSQDKTILVESDAGITIFLAESEVKSRQVDPRQYHWHCILKDDEFHFRNAFSKNMLQTDAKNCFDDSDLGPGEPVVTGKFNKKEGGFCVLPGSDDEQFTLYRTFQGRLFPISVGYEDHFKFKYPRTCWDINRGPVVHWKFESFYKWMIGDVELEYSHDDFKL